MVTSCCIKGCRNEKYPGCNLSFHSFPADESIRKQWLQVTKVTGNVAHKKICPLHFRGVDFIIKGGCIHLKQEFDKLRQDCDEIDDIQTEYLNIDNLEDDNDIQNDEYVYVYEYDDDKYVNSVDKNIMSNKEIIESNEQTKDLQNLLNSNVRNQEATKEDTSRRKRSVLLEYTANDMQRAVNAMVKRQMTHNSTAKRLKMSRIERTFIEHYFGTRKPGDERRRVKKKRPGEDHHPVKNGEAHGEAI